MKQSKSESELCANNSLPVEYTSRERMKSPTRSKTSSSRSLKKCANGTATREGVNHEKDPGTNEQRAQAVFARQVDGHVSARVAAGSDVADRNVDLFVGNGSAAGYQRHGPDAAVARVCRDTRNLVDVSHRTCGLKRPG